MKNQQGFVSTGILIAIVLGLIVVSGGAYYVTQQNSLSPAVTDTITVETPPATKKVPTETKTQTTNTPVVQSATVHSGKFADFSCIQLPKDLSVNGDSAVGTISEVKQLQHFLNTYFYTRKSGLEEDGVFGPSTAQKVVELKKWPHFESAQNKSSVVDSETRKIITDLTCEKNGSITVPIEFSVSAFANDANKTRIIADTVKEINTYVQKTTILPGSYGAFDIELDNPIDTKTLGIDFSKGNFFSGCDDTIIGTATLSDVKQKFVNDFPAGKALTMSAHLDSLTKLEIKEAACGD